MESLTTKIINSYVHVHGTEMDKLAVETIDLDEYLRTANLNDTTLEDSLEVGLIDNNLVTILLFLISVICSEIVKDGYKISKSLIMKYLEKIKNKKIVQNNLTEYEVIIIDNLKEIIEEIDKK